ncbi:fungal cellulose binding domain-containing protein [Phyllosticta citricarpa]
MKYTLISLLAACSVGTAHWNYPVLVTQGQPSGEWEFVRLVDDHYGQSPVKGDVNSAALRCNEANPPNRTSTKEVQAGEEIAFQASQAMAHPGPFQVYMARAPDGVKAEDFAGDGDVWFKIFASQANITEHQMDWPGMSAHLHRVPKSFDILLTIYLDSKMLNATIPKSTPDGDYLIRAEQISLHQASQENGAQFYVGCAQVRVTGGGTGDPGPKVAIPGAYKVDDPGIKINIWYPIPERYDPPGPPVWTG